jgi:uncharacterized membrane protein
VPETSEPVNTRLVIGPNASLTGPQARVFFGTLCVIGLGIATGFAALGYWPILPFAGLELVAVGAALGVALHRNRYREVLSFEGSRLRIEFGLVGQRPHSVCEWPRGMTRVLLEAGPHPTSPTQLVLSCGNQRLTMGSCLTDAERAQLAARLKQLISPAWARPLAVPEQARAAVQWGD